MKNYFIKTHYEYVIEYLKSINPDVFRQEKLHFGKDPTYKEYCAAISNLIVKNNLTEITKNYYYNLFFHLYHMQNCGEQIYYITPELSARLVQTYCNSDVYFLRSPFREIFVQIDPGLFYINNLEKSKTPVIGFYIYIRDINGKKHIRVMASALLKPTTELPFRDTGFYFHMEMDFTKIQDELQIYIKNEVNRKKVKFKEYNFYKDVDHIEEFATFVFNTLLYITSKDPDIIEYKPFNFEKKLKNLKSKNKKRKIEQQKENATAKKIIILGTHIKDKNKDILNIKKAGGVGAWKLKHKINVPAHWRTQWYGSKKEGTQHCENIWINSYEKGPEYADVITSKHIVK
jgi:hypothetical protein